MEKVCMININEGEVLFRRQTGGVKRFWELYNYLCSIGYSVDLYCGCTEKEFSDHGLNGTSLGLSPRTKGLFSIPSFSIFWNNREVYKKIKNKGYSCVISLDVPSTIGICLANIKNLNFLIRQDFITYRRIQYSTSGASKLSQWSKLLVGWIMEGICIWYSSRIICQCHADVETIKKRHPFLKRKINKKTRIQINNINPSWVVNKTDKNNDIIPNYDIIFIGNFDDERKGHQILLESLDILSSRGRYFTAVFIGDGKELNEYKEQYKHLNNVEFVGRIENPSDYIKASRLMIVPSESDSCPNTVMEALFYGTAVIGADRGGIPEILTNKDWLFELDPINLVDKIIDLFNNHKIEKLAEEQEIRAKELMFNWGAKIEQNLLFNNYD